MKHLAAFIIGALIVLGAVYISLEISLRNGELKELNEQ